MVSSAVRIRDHAQAFEVNFAKSLSQLLHLNRIHGHGVSVHFILEHTKSILSAFRTLHFSTALKESLIYYRLRWTPYGRECIS